MNKLIIILLFITTNNFAQHIIVENNRYTSKFDTVYNYPVEVSWWVTREHIECEGQKIKRHGSFYKEPAIPNSDFNEDYRGSGYDRGHMMPAADNSCNKEDMAQSFYFSNIAPQTPKLNRNDWKLLEKDTRTLSITYDSVFVTTGNIGEIKKIGRVSVPKFCWKIIYIPYLNIKLFYLFENNKKENNGLSDNLVSEEEFYLLINHLK